jgi:hypothetical protein
MSKPHRFKKYLLLGGFLLFTITALAFARIYMSRPPILMVTDTSFLQLYGTPRLKQKERLISASLFRRLVMVRVDENAGQEAIAIAVEEAHEAPWAVVFPFRYYGGAQRLSEQRPETRILLIGERREDLDPFVTSVRTDTALDLYRAGAAAALLTGEKRPLFFSDGILSNELREVFQQGLETQGYTEDPVYRSATLGYNSYDQIGCVIVAGPASSFIDQNLEQNLDLPVILFTWIDPAMTPQSVKLVFDDSPLALAAGALKAQGEGQLLIPSTPAIMKDRLPDKETFEKLKVIIRSSNY